MRLFERALRRAALPVAVSQGFNPRPRLSLPMPLSVGMAGLSEVADLGLAEWARPEDVRLRLQAQLPDGIGIGSVEVIAGNANRRPSEHSYHVPILPGHRLTEDRIAGLLAQRECVVERRRAGDVRTVEIRRFIKALRLRDGVLMMLLRNTDRGTARPEEVMEALGCREGTDYLKGCIVRANVNMSPPCAEPLERTTWGRTTLKPETAPTDSTR